MRQHTGIYVGKDPIPVDLAIMDEILQFQKIDLEQVSKHIETNRHNSNTTIYYILLKKFLRKGGNSIADITKYDPQNFVVMHPDPKKQMQQRAIRS